MLKLGYSVNVNAPTSARDETEYPAAIGNMFETFTKVNSFAEMEYLELIFDPTLYFRRGALQREHLSSSPP